MREQRLTPHGGCGPLRGRVQGSRERQQLASACIRCQKSRFGRGSGLLGDRKTGLRGRGDANFPGLAAASCIFRSIVVTVSKAT